MEKTFYITTSIDYVNGKPHIGHALEKVQTDAIARYNRLLGRKVFFVTGTDEHGTKIARAAKERGIEIPEFVENNRQVFVDMDKELDISYDFFISTSDKDQHWESCKKIWMKLKDKGDIYKKKYKGTYCVGHEAFVTPKDLNKDGVCDIHNAAPEIVEEENYFFKLSRYTTQIKRAIEDEEMVIWPKERKNEIVSLLEQGLEDVSFSRPKDKLEWGIPVPDDKDHTIYVWADALVNYLSAIDYESEGAKFEFWPADIQVVGKDILRFHAAIWPAMLLSAELKLPKKIATHGFISVEGIKMSKSLGNVIDPFDVIKDYGTDAIRYYLLAEISFAKDGDFSYDRLKERYNGDLAFGLGNFISRITTLGERHVKGSLGDEPSEKTKEQIKQYFDKYNECMEGLRINEAISAIQLLIGFGDKKINESRLWELPEKDQETFEKELNDLAHIASTVALMFLPIIPSSSKEILKRLGISDIERKDEWKFLFKSGDPLFSHRD